MPHEKIQQYLESIESLVRKLKNAYVERYEEEIQRPSAQIFV